MPTTERGLGLLLRDLERAVLASLLAAGLLGGALLVVVVLVTAVLASSLGGFSGGLPSLGTCAGMILLARRITDGRAGQQGFGALDIAVRRNGYGRQVDSFEADLEVAGIEGGPFPGVFIRAPLVEDAGSTEVLAWHDGHPVAVRKGNVMALAFHPELSSDLRLHREFLRLVRGRKEKNAA